MGIKGPKQIEKITSALIASLPVGRTVTKMVSYANGVKKTSS